MALTLTAGVAFANPGDRDPGFDGDGVRFVDGGVGDEIHAVLAAEQGAAYAGGQYDPINPAGATFDMAVVKIKADGALDLTYGGGDGIATFGTPTDGDAVNALALQPDGKLIVAGYLEPNGANSDFAVGRLLANGTLDPTFGDQNGGVRRGYTTLNVGTNTAANDAATAVAVQNGKVLVGGVGKSLQATGYYDRFALARYNANGTLDDTFAGGLNPIIPIPIIDPQTSELLTAIAQRRDGTLLPTDPIVTVGYIFARNTAIIRRYTPDGQPDGTFGTGGLVTIQSGNTGGVATGIYRIDSAVLLGDGKLLVLGRGTDNAFTVMRFNTNGTVDGTFGTNGSNGRVNVNFGTAFNEDLPYAMAVQRNGKIVLTGEVRVTPATTGEDFGVARLLPNGTPDPGFGVAGIVSYALVSGRDEPRGVAVLSDGAILAGGFAQDPNFVAKEYDLAFLRLQGDDELFADSFE